MRALVQGTIGFLVLVVLSVAAIASSEAEAPLKQNGNATTTLVSDPTIQAQIKRIISAKSDDDIRKELERLKALDTQGAPKLIPQLFLYSVTVTNGPDRMDRLFRDMIRRELGLSRRDEVFLIAPYLGTQDKRLQDELLEALCAADGSFHSNSKKQDFSIYQSMIAERWKTNPPLGLIAYMYDRSPAEALLTMSRIYGKPGLANDLATQARKEDRDAADSFSRRSEWWSHLYAATVMRKNPKLVEADIVKRLEQDQHPLVREALTEIRASQVKTQ